jgi:hypothetical protein
MKELAVVYKTNTGKIHGSAYLDRAYDQAHPDGTTKLERINQFLSDNPDHSVVYFPEDTPKPDEILEKVDAGVIVTASRQKFDVGTEAGDEIVWYDMDVLYPALLSSANNGPNLPEPGPGWYLHYDADMIVVVLYDPLLDNAPTKQKINDTILVHGSESRHIDRLKELKMDEMIVDFNSKIRNQYDEAEERHAVRVGILDNTTPYFVTYSNYVSGYTTKAQTVKSQINAVDYNTLGYNGSKAALNAIETDLDLV